MLKMTMIVKGNEKSYVFYEGHNEPLEMPTNLINWEEVEKEKVCSMSVEVFKAMF